MPQNDEGTNPEDKFLEGRFLLSFYGKGVCSWLDSERIPVREFNWLVDRVTKELKDQAEAVKKAAGKGRGR